MKIVSWNIRHGGGKRMGRITDQLRAWQPDIVGLSEFRATPPSAAIADFLRAEGLSYQLSTADLANPKANRLLLASRWPFEIQLAEGLLAATGRWIQALVEAPNPLTFVLMHVPNRSSGIKYEFHDAAVEVLAAIADQPAIALGDTNTGRRGIDDEVAFFNQREDRWFTNLADAGWTDIWRKRNPAAREYTWHGPKGGKGFRIDQAFVTAAVGQRVTHVRYDWGRLEDCNGRGPSDHAALIVEVEGGNS